MPNRTRVAGILALSMGTACAFAQSIEPRAYSNAPVGVNFLVAGYAYTSGGLSTDPALPITDDHIRTSSAVLAYARTLDLWGNSGKFDMIVPYTQLDGSADYAGLPVERHVNGLADPAFRLSVNFYGAPAMALAQFAGYRQDLIAGASLQVSPPLGQYDASRIVNLGTNRWTFKPELGVSKTEGPWTLEAKAAATLFTDNRDFNGGKVRSQDPIYSFSGHAIYNFSSGIWASCDATYFAGGRTTIEGAQANDLQQNWRAGATLAIPVDRLNSLKLYASRGLSARTGNSFDLVGLAWQLRWGGGL
jgi:hypothetical protein